MVVLLQRLVFSRELLKKKIRAAYICYHGRTCPTKGPGFQGIAAEGSSPALPKAVARPKGASF